MIARQLLKNEDQGRNGEENAKRPREAQTHEAHIDGQPGTSSAGKQMIALLKQTWRLSRPPSAH